jgi:PAS domain S-box-containing protein
MIDQNELLEALPVAVYTTDAEGRITFYNQAAADLWGHRPELGTAQWCGSWRLYWPDGRPMAHDECPMALALKEGRRVQGVEAIAERPDGSKVPFAPYPTPLTDASGRVIGAINVLVDVSERRHADVESARLASIVASSDDAIISKTLDGRVISWNNGATRLFGYDADEMIGKPITRIIPPELQEEEKGIIAKLRQGERIDHYETVRVAKDGHRIDISLSVSPLRDRSGTIVGASKVARDITDRKRAEKLRSLLVEELNHRIKNTMATVQAVASQSLRRAKSPNHFVAGFSGRVQALSRAHDLLTRNNLQGADVMDLVKEQVLLGGDDHRITRSGPRLMLGEQTAVHLALVLHELATNARKYGALSVPNGRLSLKWEIQTNCERGLVLEWAESGGPRVSAPRERGFGSTLIERTSKAHGGEASIRYGSHGVTARITLPLPEHVRETSALYATPQRANAGLLLQQPSDEQRLTGKKIIIIEDEPLISMDLESTLTAAGYQVVGTAGTVGDARVLSMTADCDAALLDANLAGHTVEELAATLTKRNVPFAFVTGHGRDALPQGFQNAVILRKPFSQNELIAMVELLAHQARNIVQLRQRPINRFPRG